MVLTLSHEEVLKVCSACNSFNKATESCKADVMALKTLKEIHRCKKWDEFYKAPSIYHHD